MQQVVLRKVVCCYCTVTEQKSAFKIKVESKSHSAHMKRSQVKLVLAIDTMLQVPIVVAPIAAVESTESRDKSAARAAALKCPVCLVQVRAVVAKSLPGFKCLAHQSFLNFS